MRRQRRRTNGNEIRTSKQEGREEGGQPLRPKSAWQAANQLQWKAGGSGVGGIVVGGSSPIGGGRDGRRGAWCLIANARGEERGVPAPRRTDALPLFYIAASFSSKKGALPLPSFPLPPSIAEPTNIQLLLFPPPFSLSLSLSLSSPLLFHCGRFPIFPAMPLLCH